MLNKLDQNIIKQISIIFIIMIFSNSLFAGWFEKDLREDTSYKKNNPKAYAPYDINRNKDILKRLKKRPSPSLAHQYVWVYTKKFAKRFGMPKRWIGQDDFKGALALAYRQELKNDRWCGYFGDIDNCRELDNQCVLDVYVPHNSKTVPWNSDDKMGKTYQGADSVRFLTLFRNTEYEKKKHTDKYGKLPSWYYIGSEGQKDYDNLNALGKNSKAGIDGITWAHRFKRDGFGQGGGGTVRSFHRNILDGIDLISIKGMCNFASSGDKEMQIWLGNAKYYKEFRAIFIKKHPDAIMKNGLYRKMRHKEDFPTNHKIYPGKSFMLRLKEYNDTNKKNGFFEYFKKNIKKGN